ncbi:WXG100 family type VII secretion target [Ornithinibacillus sp. 179-J 7C1 HS]|uniref:WXG100 family type VII secretion target n=1 Tax=Ornithinibacillus sp. 179-J 7C1 HS TaxID=3142384 RepID=UPI00399F5063
MANIRVTPEVLAGQGNDLQTFAAELSDILGLIDNKIKEIGDSWDGLAEQSYLEMYDNLKQSLDQFPVLVDNLGQATVSAAEAFSTVDETLQGNFRA